MQPSPMIESGMALPMPVVSAHPERPVVVRGCKGFWHDLPQWCTQQRRERRASTPHERSIWPSFEKSPICLSMADGQIVGISGEYTQRVIVAILLVGYVE